MLSVLFFVTALAGRCAVRLGRWGTPSPDVRVLLDETVRSDVWETTFAGEDRLSCGKGERKECHRRVCHSYQRSCADAACQRPRSRKK